MLKKMNAIQYVLHNMSYKCISWTCIRQIYQWQKLARYNGLNKRLLTADNFFGECLREGKFSTVAYPVKGRGKRVCHYHFQNMPRCFLYCHAIYQSQVGHLKHKYNKIINYIPFQCTVNFFGLTLNWRSLMIGQKVDCHI